MTRSDRRLLVAIAGAAAIGVVCIGVGIWGIRHPPPAEEPYWLTTVSIGGVVGGAIFIGLALTELIGRIRRGPHDPGRHTRAS